MNVGFSKRTRILLFGVSAVLIGVGAFFFAWQDLSTADQYASVASFFVGVLGLVVATLSLFTNGASPMPTHPSVPGNVVNNLESCIQVQTGAESVMVATVTAATPVQAELRRKGKKKRG